MRLTEEEAILVTALCGDVSDEMMLDMTTDITSSPEGRKWFRNFQERWDPLSDDQKFEKAQEAMQIVSRMKAH